MNRRPPQLSLHRLLAGLVLPLAAYILIRAAIGSTTGALAITEAVPATWLLVVGIARRRLDPVAVVSTVTVALALGAYALTGGLTFTIDGGSQIALALTVPTHTFVVDSTAARIVVLGTGLLVTTWYLRHQKERRERGRRSPASFEAPRLVSRRCATGVCLLLEWLRRAALRCARPPASGEIRGRRWLQPARIGG